MKDLPVASKASTFKRLVSGVFLRIFTFIASVFLFALIVMWPVYIAFAAISFVAIICLPPKYSGDKKNQKILRIAIIVFFIILYTFMYEFGVVIDDMRLEIINIHDEITNTHTAID